MELISWTFLLSVIAVTNSQPQTPVSAIGIQGQMLYSVINNDNGDIYIAIEVGNREGVCMVYRLSSTLEILGSVEIRGYIKFMIIDNSNNVILVCTENGVCSPYYLATLAKSQQQSSTQCIVSNFGSGQLCTPTGADVAGFIDDGTLYIASSPGNGYDSSELGCETPRFASRNIASLNENYLELQSGSNSENPSAIYLSSYAEPSYSPDNSVYAFGYNDFSYFVGSYAASSEEYGVNTARISRVCQSDDTYKSYMEIRLECHHSLATQSLRKRREVSGEWSLDMIYRRTVTWAQLAQASESMAESLGYIQGEDVLYYIMSFGAVCAVPMATVERVFRSNIQVCLDGGNLTTATPDNRMFRCPRNDQVTAEDAECGISSDLPSPVAGVIPVAGDAVLWVNEARIAEVIAVGKHSILMYSDGGSFYNMDILSTHSAQLFEDEYDWLECPPVNKQLLLDPDNVHSYTITNEYSRNGVETRVVKSMLSNCTAHGHCTRCVSDPYCGWCENLNRCTLMEQCPSGNWLQQEAIAFYRDTQRVPISPVCVYAELVGDFWVEFSPRSGLVMGATNITVHITSEMALPIHEESVHSINIFIGNRIRCGNVQILMSDYDYLYDSYSDSEFAPSNHSYTLICTATSPFEEYEGPLSVSIYHWSVYSNIWLNSTETFAFTFPVLRDFVPRLGPRSGGTLLQLIGDFLLTGNTIVVNVGEVRCQILRDHSTEDSLFCITGEVSDPTQSIVTITYQTHYTVESLRRYTYTEDPFIDDIYPLRAFAGGGELQYITGTNLNAIARPLFVVVMSVNGSVINEFSNECTVWNATSMTCPSPEIVAATGLEDTRRKRNSDDEDCQVVTRTPTGEPIDFQIGFVMDGVEAWLPQYIDRYLDDRYTTLTVARDPVFYAFGGDRNITSYDADGQYLVIEGERLDCGASKQDMKVEIGVDFCQPIISLYRTQLTCRPPEQEPPIRNDYTANHGLPHVSVKVGSLSDSNVYHIGYIAYPQQQTSSSAGGIKGWVIAIAVGVILLVVIVLVSVAIFFVCRSRRHKYEERENVRMKAQANDYLVSGVTEEKNFQSSVAYSPGKGLESGAVYLYPEQKGTILDQLDEGLRMQVHDALIPSDKLHIMNNDMLGKGQFGRVVLGKITDDNNSVRQVAVKSLKRNSDIEDVRKFLEEGIMMKDFDHPNVLGLIGVCIDEDQIPLIVLPYMKHGDLKSYIEKPERVLTVGKLVTYSLNVAQGMAYLASLKFVHRDLAARNCMVDDSETIKVSDFGLSRDVYEREYYASEDKKAKLPIRWMSLESIKNNIYNVKTDVWSYGVLVWELLTRGELPYASVDNWDIPNYLEKGKRLPQPAFALDDMYELLLKCWHLEPSQRPDFDDICQQLQGLLNSEDNDQNYYLQPVESPYYMGLSDCDT